MSQSKTSLPWADVSTRWEHPWHSMCSYLASFPAALARAFILMLSEEGDLVLDPFSGRGTTMLEARLTDRFPLASDLNPIAVALTRAKNTTVTLDEVMDRINELEARFDLALYTPEALVQEDEISLIYHPHTLARLCYLRRCLDQSAPVDVFLTGVVLGVMHGKARKDGSSAYLSISMPNTFSMSPDYVRRYVETKLLQRVDRDVFQILRDKVKRLFRVGSVSKNVGRVALADAKDLNSTPEFADYRGKVNLIVTSPPYLNIVNYALQNWIRMWFLREDPRKIAEILDDDLTLGESLDFLEKSTIQMKDMLHPQGIAVLVIGDVAKSRNNAISPARELIRLVHQKNLFRYIGCISDHINPIEKTTRIWKETKGRATTVDRIVILSDEPPRFKIDRLGTKLGVCPVSLDQSKIAEYAHEFAGL